MERRSCATIRAFKKIADIRLAAALVALFLVSILSITGLWPALLFGGAFKGTPSGYDYIQCTIDSVTGSFAQTQSTYTVQGDCQAYYKAPDPQGGSTFADLTDAFIWTAVGTYQPGKYATTETISVRRPTSTQFTTPVIATITSTMLCGQDPWLQPDGLSCGSVRYQQTGTLGSTNGDAEVQAYLTTTSPVVPRSSLLSAQQRAALNQQYQKQLLSNLNLQAKPTVVPVKPPTAATTNPSNLSNTSRVAILTAPAITAPIANSTVYEGQFQVKGTTNGSYTGAELVYVEFTLLGTSTAPSANSFVNIFNISLKDLLAGITVPSTITRGGIGRWQVRAQIFNPNAGPWGLPVIFNIAKLGSPIAPTINKR
jgi:hypothetical protein